MPGTIERSEEVATYRSRLDDLYGRVRTWIRSRQRDASFSETVVELAEEATGPYKAKSLEIARPGKPSIRLVPRGIFMVGAHGRVDARSRLGREMLVWVEKGGPHVEIEESPGDVPWGRVIQPVYPVVEEGWVWCDEEQGRILPLTEEVFWTRVVPPLSE